MWFVECYEYRSGPLGWEEHFTNMINEYYGGLCYLPKEDMAGEKITA